MEQIWREVEEKQTKEGWVRSRLQWEDWESLAQDAVKLAKQPALARGAQRSRAEGL
jgi:hypothetical protein